MRRTEDVLGVSVIHVFTGKQVGKVLDLLFTREGIFQGLLLAPKNWFAPGLFVPKADILSIGEDVVTIQKEPTKTLEGTQHKWLSIAQGKSKLKGTAVITSTGKQLGILEDVYFQEEMGTIIGYELSDGFFSDMMEGRRIVNNPELLSIGPDAVVIHQPEENEIP